MPAVDREPVEILGIGKPIDDPRRTLVLRSLNMNRCDADIGVPVDRKVANGAERLGTRSDYLQLPVDNLERFTAVPPAWVKLIKIILELDLASSARVSS